MAIRRILGLALTVGTLLIGSDVRAERWFDADIADYAQWPAVPLDGTWANTASATYDEGRLIVNAPDAEPLAFTPTVAKALSDAPEVTALLQFTAYDATRMPEAVDGLRGGVIVVEASDGTLAYYGLGQVGFINGWIKLGDGATISEPVAVSVRVTADGVVYRIGDTVYGPLAIVLDEEAQVTSATLKGSGVLASLYGTTGESAYAPAPPAAPTVDFQAPTVAHATATVLLVVDGDAEAAEVQTHGGAGSVAVPVGSSLVVTYQADDGYELKGTGVSGEVHSLAVSSVTTGTKLDLKDLAAVLAAIVSPRLGVTVTRAWAETFAVTKDTVDAPIPGNAQGMTYAEAYALGYDRNLAQATLAITDLRQVDGAWVVTTRPASVRTGVTEAAIVIKRSKRLDFATDDADGNFFKATLLPVR